MVAAFIGWSALSSLGLQHLPAPLAITVAFIVPMLGTALINVMIFQFAYKPMLRRSLLGILITALGMSLLLENFALLVYGPGIEAYPTLVSRSGVRSGPVHVSYLQLLLLIISLMLMVALQLFTHRTSLGLAMRALAVDHDTARLMGINVDKVILIAFVLSAFFAAAAGTMLGMYYVQIQFTLGFLLGLKAFTAAVIGGIGNVPGAMVGGIIIGLLEAYTTGYLSGRWQDAIVFAILIVMLIIKPTGLFGERVAQRM
jgi:branched-chain amino acid transport system permease protein